MGGDYHANCYLHVYDVNPNNVRFNDGNCGHSSTDYLCQTAAKATDICGPSSPSNCKVTKLDVPGYSAGLVVRVDNGRAVRRSTEKHSCPKGFKIWSPRNKNDFTTVTAKYRDCWREGHASMYLNGKQMGRSGYRNGSLQTTSVNFKNGDTLSFRDTGTNGVLHIVSITYKC